MKPIYGDFNATHPVSPIAKEWMDRALGAWGNPSSTHTLGRKAKEVLDIAREKVAERSGVKPHEVVFTSGGSEANALAILGTFFKSPANFVLVTTEVEHTSGQDSAEFIKKRGARVEKAGVDSQGNLDFQRLEFLVREYRPLLVSVMAANNETGVLFDIPKVAALCRETKSVLHVDAVQAFGKVDPSLWMADLVSISAHKVGGPKGVGALLVRGGVELVATHFGGSQEIKRRGGTENVIGIAGFGGAVEELPTSAAWEKCRALRDRFEEYLLSHLPGVFVQGAKSQRVANTSNIRFEGINAGILLSALDLDGVYVSTGAACSSGSLSPSHVLLAMGLTSSEAKECLRFSWGTTTTEDDIDRASKLVVSHVQRIRERRKQ